MSYRLRVCPGETDTGFCFDFFERFMDQCGYRDQDKFMIDHYLGPYRAKNLVSTPYIEFESEDDALLFLLRWA